jgi:hypothetical protein
MGFATWGLLYTHLKPGRVRVVLVRDEGDEEDEEEDEGDGEEDDEDDNGDSE